MSDSRILVLLGKTGSGKSSTGNTILGQQVFETGDGPVSITEHCSARDGVCLGRPIKVLDTPGTMDTQNPQRAIAEIRASIDNCPDGVDAFIVIVNWNSRFTEEESNAIEVAVGVFGPECYKRTIVVFSHVNESDFAAFEDKLRQVRARVPGLDQLLNKLGNRYLPIDNSSQCSVHGRNEQLRKLLGFSDSVCSSNPVRYRKQELLAEQRRKEEETKRAEETRRAEDERMRRDTEREVRQALDGAKDEKFVIDLLKKVGPGVLRTVVDGVSPLVATLIQRALIPSSSAAQVTLLGQPLQAVSLQTGGSQGVTEREKTLIELLTTMHQMRLSHGVGESSDLKQA